MLIAMPASAPIPAPAAPAAADGSPAFAPASVLATSPALLAPPSGDDDPPLACESIPSAPNAPADPPGEGDPRLESRFRSPNFASGNCGFSTFHVQRNGVSSPSQQMPVPVSSVSW